ncbi:MAG: histidine kinase, partial [Caulobacter sp.]|nr:histidine kinase [Caulobacter sp.]
MAARKAWTDPHRQTVLLVGLAVLYLAGVAFGDLAARAASGMVTFWPCNALLAAGLLHLTPKRRLTLLAVAAVGHLAGDRAAGDPWLLAGLHTALDLTESGLVALLIQRTFGAAPRMRGLKRAVQVVALALPVSLVAAALGAVASHLLFQRDLATVFGDGALATVLSMTVVLPAALVLLDPDSARGFEQPARHKLASYMLVAVTTLLAFSNTKSPVPFLIFPAAMLAAFQLGPRGAAVAALIAGAIAAPLTIAGLGPTAISPNWIGPSRVRLVQAFVTTLFFTALAAAMALSNLLRLKRLMARQQQAARTARIRAQAANRVKGEFLATLSHEIRTPLNSLLGFTQLLSDRPDLPAEVHRQLSLMTTAGGALRTLVDDVLEVSRVEAGGVALRPTPTRAAQVLRDAAAIVAHEAGAKGLVLEIEVVEPDARHHLLDAPRLRQVLLNLLNNAVKFTANGRVTARLEVTPGAIPTVPDRLSFSVADTGVGIDPALRGRLFERFYQADASAARVHGGAGLGLAISQGLVELMGGLIHVDSHPGVGSTFSLELEAPVAEVAPTAEPAAAPRPVARVLLVDDHPMNREIGAAFLTLAGCAVETADGGVAAVAAAAKGGFDLILMDIHMPDLDGLAATRAICALDGPAGRTPIIAMSADALPAQVALCLAAGMVDHVAKPIQRD